MQMVAADGSVPVGRHDSELHGVVVQVTDAIGVAAQSCVVVISGITGIAVVGFSFLTEA